MAYDLLITNGTVVDGNGSSRFKAYASAQTAFRIAPKFAPGLEP